MVQLSVSTDVLPEPTPGSASVPCSIGAAAKAVLEARANAREVMRVFDTRHVPMVMVDAKRRYVEVNRAARLVFRLSLEEMRTLAVDDLTPPQLAKALRQAWTRLLDTGRVAGRHQLVGRDGSPLDVVYCGFARVLPGLHVAAFAPADWPEHELELPNDYPTSAASLTPQQIRVLALAAKGYTSSELAEELVVSPATVRSHFKNIHKKLGVRTRCAAVAEAMRVGVID